METLFDCFIMSSSAELWFVDFYNNVIDFQILSITKEILKFTKPWSDSCNFLMLTDRVNLYLIIFPVIKRFIWNVQLLIS